MPVPGRERKVDVSKMSTEQADNLAVQIGEKVKEITERAVAEANSFLHIYGISCKMQIVIEAPAAPEANSEPKLKKPRKPRKAKSNL